MGSSAFNLIYFSSCWCVVEKLRKYLNLHWDEIVRVSVNQSKIGIIIESKFVDCHYQFPSLFVKALISACYDQVGEGGVGRGTLMWWSRWRDTVTTWFWDTLIVKSCQHINTISWLSWANQTSSLMIISMSWEWWCSVAELCPWGATMIVREWIMSRHVKGCRAAPEPHLRLSTTTWYTQWIVFMSQASFVT